MAENTEEKEYMWVDNNYVTKKLLFWGYPIRNIRPNKDNHRATDHGFDDTQELHDAYFKAIDEIRKKAKREREFRASKEKETEKE